MLAVDKYRGDVERRKGRSEQLADWMTKWSGSMVFIYLHALWFGIWVPLNLGWLGLKVFDPYPFGLLTSIVSLEAIFLATFVLVSQNRQAELADRRAELDLHVNLLAEHEMTRVLAIVDSIAKKLECKLDDDGELQELEKDVEPEQLLKELERKAATSPTGPN